jgi:hypothetical protein
MKEAMWRVDPAGSFRFSDATDFRQPVLFEPQPDRELLRRLICARFAATRAAVGEVEQFVVEETPFLATHFKRVLAAMEDSGDIAIISPPPNRRRGTFALSSLVIEFRAKRIP